MEEYISNTSLKRLNSIHNNRLFLNWYVNSSLLMWDLLATWDGPVTISHSHNVHPDTSSMHTRARALTTQWYSTPILNTRLFFNWCINTSSLMSDDHVTNSRSPNVHSVDDKHVLHISVSLQLRGTANIHKNSDCFLIDAYNFIVNVSRSRDN